MRAEPGSSAGQPRAVILGCAGERLSAEERRLFAAANPLGFVLFRRNCRARDQLRSLVDDMRACVGRGDAPVLIDQEGGRVARLRPPEWPAYPAAAQIASLPDGLAEEAAFLGARLIAGDLAEVGVTVDAAPVLDLPVAGADPVIGDRAFGREPARVIRLGRAVCDGLLAGGVLPIVKHIPGHGRARVDSHQACPVVDASPGELANSDFVPFRALSATPWAMTAHIVFTAFDPASPVTFSRSVVDTIIRGQIGFEGVLVSDDISMGALDGSLGERIRRALAAGCDLVLHCTGILDEMAEVADAASPLSEAAAARVAKGEMRRRKERPEFDRRAGEARFAELLSAAASSADGRRA